MAIDPPYRLDPFRNIVNIQWEAQTTAGPNPYDHCWTTTNTFDLSAVSYYWGPGDPKEVYWNIGGTEIHLTPGNSNNEAVIAAVIAWFNSVYSGYGDSQIVFNGGLYVTWDVGPTGASGDAIVDVAGINWTWNDEDTSCGPTPEGPNPGPPGPDGRPTYP